MDPLAVVNRAYHLVQKIEKYKEVYVRGSEIMYEVS